MQMEGIMDEKEEKLCCVVFIGKKENGGVGEEGRLKQLTAAEGGINYCMEKGNQERKEMREKFINAEKQN